MQQTIILIIGSIGGAITTFSLQKYGFSSVVASCIAGLTGALLGNYLKLPHFSLIVFTGSFIGMTSTSIGTLPLMVAGGVLSGLMYSYSINMFKGLGGRLGTIAFISLAIAFYTLPALKKLLTVLTKKSG